ncbi:MAG: hypothetical protein ACYSUD_03435 [Planctomycetota bacterium]|jgi:hypothetical protein
MHSKQITIAAVGLLTIAGAAQAQEDVWRFDCGTPKSPVMEGYRRLAASQMYNEAKGYGWEHGRPANVEFRRPVRDRRLRGSAGHSRGDLGFRLDVPDGIYRVAITVGDLSKAIGSIDLAVNGSLAAEQLAVWAPGGYRLLDRTPAGWWNTFRTTVKVTDRTIRIAWKKNQKHYNEQMAEQAAGETPYAQWYHRVPIIQEPPYHYIGYPFVGNSVMAIEVVPYRPGPVEMVDGKLQLHQRIDSVALTEAIKQYNSGDFAAALAALERADDSRAQVAKAVVTLWLAGRLDTEIEQEVMPKVIEILRSYLAKHPGEYGLAEILSDAEVFQKAMGLHRKRGQLGKNHFLENDKAIGWWLMIRPDSPLYDKARLHIARAAHMLKPYFPVLGTERQIFLELEKKCPGNRFVKYHLHQEWEPTGDDGDYYDWVMEDYAAKAKGAPEWARVIYPAFCGLIDLSEWWVRFRQEPEGHIGGGWGDDVEMVGLFGYYGYVSRGVSELCVRGTGNLVNGVWNLSEVDPEIGYCQPMADAEHSAEWTGNTLGMMVQLDYGNPTWIERSMKTGKLIRDLWTDYDKNGRRHFRANFFGAAQVGSGPRTNDSWINYRAVSPATSVLNYNNNPTIARLYVELAEAWLAAAMSTDRGKPRGVIPAQVSFPERVLGGLNSPNWWTAAHPPRTVNYDWQWQQYKGYVLDVMMAAYKQTRDEKFLEPLRLEYELACKHGFEPEAPSPLARRSRKTQVKTKAKPGSEAWVAAKAQQTERWLQAKQLIEGRQGQLQNRWTRAQIIESGRVAAEHLKKNWPVSTSEAGPTDRVGFPGIITPFFIYTGGSWGGPLLRAAVTYENTTKDFAAAVVAADPQGLRIWYCSLAPDERTIGIVPWELEPGGTYRLVLGVDSDEDGEIDRRVEEREFVFPQHGSPINIKAKPRVNYIVEIDQLKRGRPAGPAPDPGLSAEDIRFNSDRNLLMARIHNVGSKPVRGVKVAFYDGDPQKGGRRVGLQTIPNIEPPNDLEPRTVTVGVNYRIESPTEIYIVVDPDNEIADEITTFNNVAHKRLPEAKKEQAVQDKPKPAVTSFRRGR